MERVRDQRGAEYETHLTFGHSWLELIDHLLRDDVSLLDIGLVRMDASGGRQ
jgi:hypothetical protein